jgi:hypothetical protein
MQNYWRNKAMNIHLNRKLRRPATGLAIVGAVAFASVALNQGAFAQVPEDGHSTDEHANYCYFLQEQYGEALDAYSNAPEGSAAKHDAGMRLSRVKDAWAHECQPDFGNVYIRLAGQQIAAHSTQSVTLAAVRR